MRRKIILAKTMVLGALLSPSFGFGAVVRESNPPVPNVVGAFNTLKHHGEALGFNMRSGDPFAPGPGHSLEDITGKTHYQGMQRWQAPGFDVPYLFVTRAGTTDADRANMLVVRMGSRNPLGERMRSNRLVKDRSVNDTPPPADDVVALNWRFDDFHHVGGIQLAGDILAVPLEDPHGCRDCETGMVMFLNVANPLQPTPLPGSLRVSGHKAGVVGIAKLPEPDGHFLLVLAWGTNERLEFYRSTEKSFFHPQFQFVRHDTWIGTELIGADEWPQGTAACYQSLSLVNQLDGRVFMIAARNRNDIAPVEAPPLKYNEDYAAVFEIFGFQGGTATTNIVIVQHLSEKRLYCESEGDTDNPVRNATAKINADFLAASGTYVSPSGELILYGAEHWNDGPNRSVRMVEFRHELMGRPGNPLPAKIPHVGGDDGKYSVGEGSTVVLDASRSRPPALKPWVELFDDDNFLDRGIIIDWPDRDFDDYKDFRQKLEDFNDKATSVRWYAPPGWLIRLHNQDNWGMDESFIDLFGNGGVQGHADLGTFGFNDRVTSVRFHAPAGTSIDAPLTFGWKLVNPPADAGTLSGSGPQVNFQAVNGPNSVDVELILGPAPEATETARITITNVPPAVTGFSVTPSVTQTTRVDVVVNFSDPGTTDTHTLRITWGDGSISNLTAATGARTFTSHHVYANPFASNQLNFNIALRLRDNDGGEANTNRAVTLTFLNPSSLADSDADGLPDTWEDFYLGSREGTGPQDKDGDGQSNLAEYVAGTDPLDPVDALALQIRSIGSNHELSFPAHLTGSIGYGPRTRFYTVECTSDLSGGWRPLGAVNNAGGLDGIIHLLQPSAGTTPRFYRVRAAFEIAPFFDGIKHWWRGEGDGRDEVGGRPRILGAWGTSNGIVGQAFSFDSVNQEASFGLLSEPRIQPPWTASLWVNRTPVGGSSASLLMDSATALKAEQFGTRRVGFTRFGIADYSFNYTLPTQTWTHVVFVCAPGQTSLFVNGTNQGTIAASIELPLRVLGGGVGERFSGMIDEVSVYNRALATNEVQLLHIIESGQ